MQCKYLPAKKVISFQPDQLLQLLITEAVTRAQGKANGQSWVSPRAGLAMVMLVPRQ